MDNWCKDCARKDGHMHLKCKNCKWYIGSGGDDFKWDRFIPINDVARHPSSFLPTEIKKESGFINRILRFMEE